MAVEVRKSTATDAPNFPKVVKRAEQITEPVTVSDTSHAEEPTGFAEPQQEGAVTVTDTIHTEEPVVRAELQGPWTFYEGGLRQATKAELKESEPAPPAPEGGVVVTEDRGRVKVQRVRKPAARKAKAKGKPKAAARKATRRASR